MPTYLAEKKKCAFYASMRIFNGLPLSLTTLMDENAKFKVALRE